MTVNAARQPRRRTIKPAGEPAVIAPIDSMAIGEINQTVFDCPNCSRPLAIGTRRCPACRTRLALGVPLSKATIFATGGLAVGVLLGSVAGFVVAATQVIPAPLPVAVLPSAAPITAPSAAPVTLPSAVPVATAPAPSAATDTSMPPIVRSALVQAITVNQRLSAASEALRASLSSPSSFDASEVAQLLRSVSADSVYGMEIVDRVSGWPASATLGDDLAGAYGSIHDSATETLVYSVRDTSAYRDGARAMVRLLSGLGAVDSQARDLAVAQGAELPDPSALP